MNDIIRLLSNFADMAARKAKAAAYEAPNTNTPLQDTFIRMNRINCDEQLNEGVRGQIALVLSTTAGGVTMAVSITTNEKNILFNTPAGNFTVCSASDVSPTLNTKLHMVADIYFRDICKEFIRSKPLSGDAPGFKYGGFVMKHGQPSRIGVVIALGAEERDSTKLCIGWGGKIMNWETVEPHALRQASMDDLGRLPSTTQDRLMQLHGYIICKYTTKYTASSAVGLRPFDYYTARAVFSSGNSKPVATSSTVSGGVPTRTVAGTVSKKILWSSGTDELDTIRRIQRQQDELRGRNGFGDDDDKETVEPRTTRQSTNSSISHKRRNREPADAEEKDDAETVDPVSLLGQRRKRLAAAKK